MPLGNTWMIALAIISEHPGTLIFTQLHVYDKVFQTLKSSNVTFLKITLNLSVLLHCCLLSFLSLFQLEWKKCRNIVVVDLKFLHQNIPELSREQELLLSSATTEYLSVAQIYPWGQPSYISNFSSLATGLTRQLLLSVPSQQLLLPNHCC